MVGLNGASTASVAYHEAVAYARERKQGRRLGANDPNAPPVPLVQHPDVRRMLLRQKAIVEGSFGLLAYAARCADVAAHTTDEAARTKAKLLLDLLTPIAKTFPAEKGFEANALALQVHGGYGYSSEYMPEAWLRDQKLNSIHEGTTTIQGLDLLGRKAVAGGGAALMALAEEVTGDLERAAAGGLDVTTMRKGLERLLSVTVALGARGAGGDVAGMLAHSADYMELASAVVIGWMWTKLAARAPTDDFTRGLRAAAQYWLATEVPRVHHLADLCEQNERSFVDLQDAWL
jgi:butyryl-CoA dehydrogenase